MKKKAFYYSLLALAFFSLFFSEKVYADTILSQTTQTTEAHISSTSFIVGQCFKTPTGDDYNLTGFKITLSSNSGGSGGSMTAKLYASTGTMGTSAIPTGAVLSTSNSTSLTSMPTWPTFQDYQFDFNNYRMTANSDYCITIDSTNATGFNILIQRASGNPFANGNDYINTTPNASYDLRFYLYGTIYTPPEEGTVEWASSTPATLDDIAFGQAIIITMLSLGFVGFTFNTLNKKKKWQ